MKILQKRMKAIEKSKAKTKARSQKPKAKGQKPSLQTKQNKKMKSQIKLQYPPSTCCLGLGMQATATLNLCTTISLFWSKIEIMDALCHRKGTCYWKIRTLSLDALQKPCTCEARSSRSFLLTTWSLRGLHLATSAWENTLFWEPQRNPKLSCWEAFTLATELLWLSDVWWNWILALTLGPLAEDPKLSLRGSKWEEQRAQRAK